MTFVLYLKPKARKNLDKIPQEHRRKIVTALREIVEHPFAGKALIGNRKGEYSVGVWPYRIIYTVMKKELLIIVIDVDHRGNVY